mgnify:CR=1 FL=1
MTEVKSCPICGGTAFKTYITTKDYSVSNETFTLQECITCGFVFTNPRPSETDLDRYYQSDNYISHSDKPRTFFDRIYWLAREYALRNKFELVNSYLPKTILDYGCGTGAFLEYCKRQGLAVTGMEPSPTARTIAARKIKPAAVHKSIDDLIDTYDVITLWHVLEHIPDLQDTIIKLSKALSENGTLIVAVPNITSWESTQYNEYWAAYDVPRHLWHFSPRTITRLLAKHNLLLKEVRPMKLDSFYVSLLSEKYRRQNKAGLFGMINALKNGMLSNLKARKTGAYSSLIYIFRHA